MNYFLGKGMNMWKTAVSLDVKGGDKNFLDSPLSNRSAPKLSGFFPWSMPHASTTFGECRFGDFSINYRTGPADKRSLAEATIIILRIFKNKQQLFTTLLCDAFLALKGYTFMFLAIKQ